MSIMNVLHDTHKCFGVSTRTPQTPSPLFYQVVVGCSPTLFQKGFEKFHVTQNASRISERRILHVRIVTMRFKGVRGSSWLNYVVSSENFKTGALTQPSLSSA
jgi:hypothetical protein